MTHWIISNLSCGGKLININFQNRDHACLLLIAEKMEKCYNDNNLAPLPPWLAGVMLVTQYCSSYPPIVHSHNIWLSLQMHTTQSSALLTET